MLTLAKLGQVVCFTNSSDDKVIARVVACLTVKESSKDKGIYTLFYLGLFFAFPIPSQFTNCYYDGRVELPLEFLDEITLVTCSVSIYDSSYGKKVGVRSLMNKASAPPLHAGNIYMEEVQVKLGKELYFIIGK
ncbi:UPF0183 protein, partial [Mucuna pruriens]